MTTLTVNIPDGATSKFSEFIKTLGGEVIEIVTHKLPMDKLEEGLSEVKDIQQGKSKGLNLSDILGK